MCFSVGSANVCRSGKGTCDSSGNIFGRRTNQIFLKPFDYLDSARFVPNYSYEEKAVVYGVTDGMYRFWYRFVPMARAAIAMDRGRSTTISM